MKGGTYYAHRIREIRKRIERSRKLSGNQYNLEANKRYWKRLRYISDDMAHQISRQMVDFCVEYGADVIVLPKYDKEYSKYIMAAVGKWAPLHLNYQVRRKLKYKAWQAGLLLLESSEADINRCCAVCGAPVRKRGEIFICENGHQGNRRINAAMNLGRKTWENLGKNMSNPKSKI